MKVTLVHKKIRLSEDLLAWEHEKFSLQKVPAATISHYPSPHINHMTMFTNRSLWHGLYMRILTVWLFLVLRSDVDANILTRNVKLLAETLARHVYNLSSLVCVYAFYVHANV